VQHRAINEQALIVASYSKARPWRYLLDINISSHIAQHVGLNHCFKFGLCVEYSKNHEC
jgi:hypothetical protein